MYNNTLYDIIFVSVEQSRTLPLNRTYLQSNRRGLQQNSKVNPACLNDS